MERIYVGSMMKSFLAQLNKLCRRLADVHGQYDHHPLIPKPSSLLIHMVIHILPIKEKVAELYYKYSSTKQELSPFWNPLKETCYAFRTFRDQSGKYISRRG